MIQAIFFDFDGVILESVDIKTDVFRDLFRKHPKHVKRIVQLHKDNAGVSRYTKFEIIYRDFLKQPLSEDQKKKLGRQFEAFVMKRILHCRFVPGAKAFLKKHSKHVPLFVLSATPVAELKSIIQKRGLSPYFKEVFGYPTSKQEAMGKILKRWKFNRKYVVMIGDARADWEAATKQRIPFIGRVVPKHPPLYPKTARRVKDLRELEKHIRYVVKA